MDFNIIRVASVTMNVLDLDRARAWYVDALGFIETACDEEHLYLRGLEEHVHHSLVLKKADKIGVHALSYKVTGEEDLYALERLFTAKGLPVKWEEAGATKAVGKTLRVQDISGLPLEFFYEMEPAERLLQRYDLYRGARIQRIDHVNCAVTDVQLAYDFFVNDLGFKCSEYTETDEEHKLWAAWLHRKPNVHDQAFMNGRGPRLHHVGFWLSDPMSVIHACDVLASLGYADSIERGPGRHGLSNAFFLYLRDPDGNRIELYTGDYLTSDPDFKPIRWSINDPRRQTFWGHAAPDSWFEEATPCLDIFSQQEVSVKDALLSQQKPKFVGL